MSARHIIITRNPGPDTPDITNWRHRLTASGFRISEIPLIETHVAPYRLPEAEADKRWDWLFFTSRNGVNAFYAQAPGFKYRTRIAAVGPATAEALLQHGHHADFIPSRFHAEAAAQEFARHHGQHGLRILWPCGNLAHPQLAQLLNANGLSVDPLIVYETRLRTALSPEEQAMFQQKTSVVAFTSPSAVMAYRQLQPETPEHEITVACLGPRTAIAAKKHLHRVDIQAEPHTMDGLANAILAHYAEAGHGN